jgi:hypothetical protein
MTLDEIIQQLNLTPLTSQKDFAEITPSAGYTSDLLSCVMANAPKQGIWVTLQAHSNIIAVAALLELCAVIITEDAKPDAATLAKAEEEGVILLGTAKGSFDIIGKLWEMGLRADAS